MEEEIIFVGAYKDFKLGVRYPLNNASESDVMHILGHISSQIEEPAYSFAGINIQKIGQFAKPSGTGLGSVVSFLESNPQSKIKETLLKCADNKLLLPAAESYFFNQLLSTAKVDFKVTEGMATSSIVSEEEQPGDQIALIANFKGWISIKKLGLDDVQDYEVSAILSGITHTIVNKAFDFSGCNKNDELVSNIAKGRKSYGNLLNALRTLETSLTGNRLDDAYLVCKVFEKLGFKPYPSPEMLSQAHPDIKPPKVRGRRNLSAKPKNAPIVAKATIGKPK